MLCGHQEHHAITKDFLQLNMCLLTMLDTIDALYLDVPESNVDAFDALYLDVPESNVDASTSVETIPLLRRR